jgi:hypothetical protein
VVLLGPSQTGKTTLALDIAKRTPSVYLDLEDPDDRARLSNPGPYLAGAAICGVSGDGAGFRWITGRRQLE